jgi:hypothetical protein
MHRGLIGSALQCDSLPRCCAKDCNGSFVICDTYDCKVMQHVTDLTNIPDLLDPEKTPVWTCISQGR